MINWSELLFAHRQATIPDAHNIKDWEEFYHDCSGKSRLVITAGDSWTYGDSLGEQRLDQVYGRLVSEQLDADWINIGSRGRSNSWILRSLQYLAPRVKTRYKEVIAIVTMTENCRDVETSYTFPLDYFELFSKTGDTPAFYEAVLAATESYWMNQLQDIQKSDCQIIVGHNFVWHDLNTMPGIQLLESNWIEKIADYQKRDRPIKAKLVTGWIFDTMLAIHQSVPGSKAVFQQWALPYIDLANQVNAWLEASDLNNKGMSKHPVAQGHKIWADYILTHVEK